LGDPDRRRKYDELRAQYQAWQQHGGRAGGDFNWGQWQAAPGERVYTRSVSPEDLEDLFGGADPFSDFFSSLYGQAEYRQAGQPRRRRGRDVEAAVEITLDEAFRGTTRAIQIGDRRIEAKIPAGARTGSRIRLTGQGGPGAAGGPAGDLFLLVEVLPDERFERDGDDLTTEVPIDIYTAAAGGDARVPTLDGAVRLKIPPRTDAGKTFRLRGKGMPRLERPSERGDLFARARLVLPEHVSDGEIETLRGMAAARQPAVR
jgi:curved DNA-binding protein